MQTCENCLDPFQDVLPDLDVAYVYLCIMITGDQYERGSN